MEGLFDSPKFLVSQTLENLDEFDTLCQPIFKDNCYSNVIDVDPESGNKTFKVKFNRKVPGKARHIAATAISDLRHALDQAACASVRALTGADPSLLYFPFATNPNDLMGRLRKSFPDELHPVFVSFQPFPTGEAYEGGNKLLSDFGKTAGPNKHQVTCKVGGRITEFQADSVQGTGGIIEMGLPPRWDIDNNELIVGITFPNGHIDYNFGISFYVALAQAGPLSGAPASDVLRTLARQTGNIVDSLEREATRIVKGRNP